MADDQDDYSESAAQGDKDFWKKPKQPASDTRKAISKGALDFAKKSAESDQALAEKLANTPPKEQPAPPNITVPPLSLHHGGKVKKTANYRLLKGERVLSRAQVARADKGRSPVTGRKGSR